MRIGAFVLVTIVAAAWGAQLAAAGAGAAEQAAGQPPRPGLYPALQRPPGDPELIARGQGIYGINCRACHGVDLRGGDLGGPNLLRSQLVLRDLQGELMGPVIQNGSTVRRTGRGCRRNRCPTMTCGPWPSTSTASSPPRRARAGRRRVRASSWTYSSATRPPDRPTSPRSAPRVIRRSATCRASPPGSPNCRSSRTPGSAAAPAALCHAPRSSVTVTTSAGERVAGRLERLDDFVVVLTTNDGHHRSFSRRGRRRADRDRRPAGPPPRAALRVQRHRHPQRDGLSW